MVKTRDTSTNTGIDIGATAGSYPPSYTKNFDDVLIAEHLQIAERRTFNNEPGGTALRERALAEQKRRVPEFEQWTKSYGDWLKMPKPERGEEPHDVTASYATSGVHPTLGLALSGGGIRSAAFCLGAMQALAVKDLLKKFDYVSSVSGGGYSSIAATLAANAQQGKFPFAGGNDDLKDTPEMRTLRNNANYLKFGKFWPMLQNLAIVCKGVATNIILTIAVLLFLAALTLWANPTIASLDVAGLEPIERALPAVLRELKFGVSIPLIGLGFLVSMCWAVYAGLFGTVENFNSILLKVSSVLLVLSVVSVFFELQPVLVKQMISERELKIADKIGDCIAPQPARGILILPGQETQYDCKTAAEKKVEADEARKVQVSSDQAIDGRDGGKSVLEDTKLEESSGFKRLVEWLQTILAPALAFTALASRYVGDLLKAGSEGEGWRPAVKRLIGRSIVWAAGLALPVVLWVAYLGLFYWGVVVVNKGVATAMFAPAFLRGIPPLIFAADEPYSFAQLYGLVALVLALIWLLASGMHPNANSLHGLYRGRLGNAFCVPWANGNAGILKLSHVNTCHSPIHLINAALNVQASEAVNQRGRNADFFAFSNSYVGSAATGYAATSRYEELEKRLDYPTAMAISGAAASSNMGAQSIRPLTFTLALLNIRLGGWLRNPMIAGGRTWSREPFYFLAELAGRLKENRSMIYLTDGGHIENLGVYELLRRRCKLIVAVDAEADRDMNFSSLITLQRYARIDFGCRIELDWSRIRQQSLAIQKGNSAPSGTKGVESSPAVKASDGPHCAIGQIFYEGGGRGILFYVKSSLSGDENDYIRDYNRRNYDFPHETTGDQNFSEEQFEVYRALGFHALHGAVSGRHGIQVSDVKVVKLNVKAKSPAVIKEVRTLLRQKPKTKLDHVSR